MKLIGNDEITPDAKRINAEYAEAARQPILGLTAYQKSMIGFIFFLCVAVLCLVLMWLNFWWGLGANNTLYVLLIIPATWLAGRFWRHRGDPEPS